MELTREAVDALVTVNANQRTPMKPTTHSLLAAMLLLLARPLHATDARLDSWLTTYSGKYARIVETDAELAAGATKTTWSRNGVTQSLPAYSGVQEIYSSSNYI